MLSILIRDVPDVRSIDMLWLELNSEQWSMKEGGFPWSLLSSACVAQFLSRCTESGVSHRLSSDMLMRQLAHHKPLPLSWLVLSLPPCRCLWRGW